MIVLIKSHEILKAVECKRWQDIRLVEKHIGGTEVTLLDLLKTPDVLALDILWVLHFWHCRRNLCVPVPLGLLEAIWEASDRLCAEAETDAEGPYCRAVSAFEQQTDLQVTLHAESKATDSYRSASEEFGTPVLNKVIEIVEQWEAIG